ncbi:MAG: transmembrane Mn(2+) transporter [Planctomycetes bacterium B3_Pla]|nr:MAG: transmembrane Mn(2+) transporter [Planctomycetes bacterium B3_Pla]
MPTEDESKTDNACDNRELQSPDTSFVTGPPRTLGATLLRLGPGMIVAGSIVGSGELIATTKAGAEAGFCLLWLIIIGCVIKVSTQIELGRYTITWSQTPLKALDGVPGPRLKVNWLLWYWVIVILLVISQQGGIVGGVGQTLAISKPLTSNGREYNRLHDKLATARVDLKVAQAQGADNADTEQLQQKITSLAAETAELREPKDAYLWAAIVAIATSMLLLVGRYGLIQLVATVFVIGFTVVTILTVVMLQTKPDWAVTGGDLAGGLSFRLPPAVEGTGKNPIGTALAAFGIIGVGAVELIMYPYWCLEKGYAKFTGPRDSTDGWIKRARGWMHVMNIDAWLSMVVYTFATVAFYLLGAAVLGRTGLNPSGEHMIRTLAAMYVPVFGSWADGVFLSGAFAVLYSTFFVAAAGCSRMVADALGLFGITDGSERARLKWTRIVSAVWPLVALLLYIGVRAPTKMVLASGTGQAIMLPMLGAAALYFRYRRSDENLRPGRVWDAMLWLSLAGFAVIGVWSLVKLV